MHLHMYAHGTRTVNMDTQCKVHSCKIEIKTNALPICTRDATTDNKQTIVKYNNKTHVVIANVNKD